MLCGAHSASGALVTAEPPGESSRSGRNARLARRVLESGDVIEKGALPRGSARARVLLSFRFISEARTPKLHEASQLTILLSDRDVGIVRSSKTVPKVFAQ